MIPPDRLTRLQRDLRAAKAERNRAQREIAALEEDITNLMPRRVSSRIPVKSLKP